MKAHSFFGAYDLWKYEAIYDKKLCEDCLKHSLTKYFIGTHLRGTFKHLKIVDANTVEVWVHPNCRCRLHRVTRSWEYLMEIEPFLKD